MKYHLTTILILSICLTTTLGQINTDSLTNIVEQAKGKDRVDLLTKFANDYIYESEEFGLEFANEALKQATKIGYKKGEANAYLALGEYYNKKYEDSVALANFQKAYALSLEINYNEGITESLTSISYSYYYLNHFDKCVETANQALEYARGTKNKSEEGKIHQVLGNVYRKQNDLGHALDAYQKSLDVRKELEDLKDVAKTYNQIGLVYYQMGDIEQAIENYQNAIALREQVGDLYGKGIDAYNIGNAYKQIEQYESAIGYFQDALDCFEQTSNELGIANAYNVLGVIQFDLANYQKALDYYQMALEKYTITGKQSNISDVYDNIGNTLTIAITSELNSKWGASWDDSLHIYRPKKYIQRFDSASINYQKSLEIRNQLGDMKKVAISYNNLAINYHYQLKYDEAIAFYQKAYEINTELSNELEAIRNLLGMTGTMNNKGENRKALKILSDNLDYVKSSKRNELIYKFYEQISKAYRAMGNNKKALDYFILYTETKEKHLNEERLKQTAELETKYETEKKEAKIQLLDKENRLQEATIKKRNQVIVFFIAFIVVILGSAVMLLRLNRKIQKANIELGHKNEVITKQKEEITDSILYARRIQRAVLPSVEVTQKALPEHFILFRPRDIVSGDFYWLSQQENKIVIAAADCTGHGVPGAFMSMLGVSFLNEIVNKEEVVQANLILNELRSNVKSTLSQTGAEGEAKDGMDIALVIIDLEKNSIQYAGAYNPLYLYRNGELMETKADKMPIGIYVKERETFTNHEIEIEKGDTFYIFSDGYVDQFGGPDRRKFMSKPFKRLLADMQKLPMAEQKEVLNQTIDEWRGDLPQVDDIILIGVRFG